MWQEEINCHQKYDMYLHQLWICHTDLSCSAECVPWWPKDPCLVQFKEASVPQSLAVSIFSWTVWIWTNPRKHTACTPDFWLRKMVDSTQTPQKHWVAPLKAALKNVKRVQLLIIPCLIFSTKYRKSICLFLGGKMAIQWRIWCLKTWFFRDF